MIVISLHRGPRQGGRRSLVPGSELDQQQESGSLRHLFLSDLGGWGGGHSADLTAAPGIVLLREGRNKCPNWCDRFPAGPATLMQGLAGLGSQGTGLQAPKPLPEPGGGSLGEGTISEKGQVLERAQGWWQRSPGLAFKGTAGGTSVARDPGWDWPEGPSPAPPRPAPPRPSLGQAGPCQLALHTAWLCACGRTRETPAPRSVRP